MVGVMEFEVSVASAFDPFTDSEEFGGGGVGDYIHIRIQQRNGRKSLTTVQGLNKDLKYERILKDLKKELCCNGNFVQDKELGKILQLQGDQRDKVSRFLLQARPTRIASKSMVSNS